MTASGRWYHSSAESPFRYHDFLNFLSCTCSTFGKKKYVTPLKLKDSGAVLLGKKTKTKDPDQDPRKGLKTYRGLGGGRRQTRQSWDGGNQGAQTAGWVL